MRLNPKRCLTWLVLAICIIGSIFGMGGMHLHRQRNAVLDVFYEGAAAKGQPALEEILKRAEECAQVMAVEAQHYLGRDYTAAALTLFSLECHGESCSPENCFPAYKRIREQADVMYNGMYAKKLLDGERVNFKRAYDEFWRCDLEIRRHLYCEMAAEYNQSIASFPASAIAAVAGAGELNCLES